MPRFYRATYQGFGGVVSASCQAHSGFLLRSFHAWYTVILAYRPYMLSREKQKGPVSCRNENEKATSRRPEVLPRDRAPRRQGRRRGRRQSRGEGNDARRANSPGEESGGGKR